MLEEEAAAEAEAAAKLLEQELAAKVLEQELLLA